jgi:hypothetical protein
MDFSSFREEVTKALDKANESSENLDKARENLRELKSLSISVKAKFNFDKDSVTEEIKRAEDQVYSEFFTELQNILKMAMAKESD